MNSSVKLLITIRINSPLAVENHRPLASAIYDFHAVQAFHDGMLDKSRVRELTSLEQYQN
jgi:hypothetical protein